MEKLILKKYGLFLDNIPQNWQHLSGLAYTPLRFFYLADIQIQGFLLALDNEFKEFHKSTPKDYSQQCYSYCYGFYTLIRTCLEVSRKFSDAFQGENFSKELSEYRKSASVKIQEVIDIANNYIKHPVENKDKVTWYEPGGLDVSGTLSLYEWSTTDDKHFVVLTITPKKDIVLVYAHLEKLAEIYFKKLNSEILQNNNVS